jgi:pimeloyl-ACP methyl ester carboxylesterase
MFGGGPGRPRHSNLRSASEIYIAHGCNGCSNLMRVKIPTVTSKDGTRIAYDKVGRGPVAILILGALKSRKSGASLAKLLASRFTVISYDRRGRGDSTDTAPYSPQREVEDVAALIEEAGEPARLYGHSSGAAIAIMAASELGRRVTRLAVYEAPYALDAPAFKAARDYDRKLEKLLAAKRDGDAVALFMRAVGVSDKQIQAVKKMPMWRGLVSMAPTLAYESAVLGKGHALPVALLGDLATPTLVMHGGAGARAMRDASKALSQAIPNSQLRTLAGQTHGVRPKVLAPVLAEFFA